MYDPHSSNILVDEIPVALSYWLSGKKKNIIFLIFIKIKNKKIFKIAPQVKIKF